MSAPKDPLFYSDLDAMSQRVGAKSEDLLWVWSSETQLNPATDWQGASRTISTLMKNVVVPVPIDTGTWDRFPTMSAREQLPYIEKAVYGPAHARLGRAFRSTFETYLVNAAPGLLRSDGAYSEASPMYVGSNYPDNWTMDNYPRGVSAAQADGVKLVSLRATYPYAQKLVAQGVLKGYVSLGDLRTFAARLPTSGGVLGEALGYLRALRAHPDQTYIQASATTPACSYTPDFDSSFSSGAPVDTRVATPDAAKKKMPSTAAGSYSGVPVKRELGAGAIAIGFLATVATAVALTRK
jgi:hypothetical protein